jgi:tetratricopeptide (TPR) repeat protein
VQRGAGGRRLGRYQEAGHWALRGLELGSSEDLATQLAGLGVRATVLARRADVRAALALAEEAESLARTTDSPVAQGNAALALAEVLYLSGDHGRGAELAQLAIEHYQRKGATAYAARAQRLQAALAALSATGPGP